MMEKYDAASRYFIELADEYEGNKPPATKQEIQRKEQKLDKTQQYKEGSVIFLGKNRIDVSGSGNYPPKMNPCWLLYPKDNHHAQGVESQKLQKTKLVVTCKSEDNIFTFYNALRHIVVSYNIRLQPLKQITKEIGLCQITKENSIGYGNGTT